MTRKTTFIFIGLLVIAAVAYYMYSSNQPQLNVEPHAAHEIEKAKKRR